MTVNFLIISQSKHNYIYIVFFATIFLHIQFCQKLFSQLGDREEIHLLSIFQDCQIWIQTNLTPLPNKIWQRSSLA